MNLANLLGKLGNLKTKKYDVKHFKNFDFIDKGKKKIQIIKFQHKHRRHTLIIIRNTLHKILKKKRTKKLS